jgi:sugar O-acyltransferase (sialic acid O-acetyltransferase NeuD family)
MNNVFIWGGGRQARLLIAMLYDQLSSLTITGIFDSTSALGSSINGVEITANYKIIESLLDKSNFFVVAVGGEFGYARNHISSSLIRFGLKPINVISPRSIIDNSVEVGAGVVVMPGANLQKFVCLSDDVIVNTSATVDHETLIDAGVHIMGSCAIAGAVKIEKFATIGTNATVLPELTIKEGGFVGAGSVVTRDVGEGDLVIGCPARKINSWEYKKIFEKDKMFFDSLFEL